MESILEFENNKSNSYKLISYLRYIINIVSCLFNYSYLIIFTKAVQNDYFEFQEKTVDWNGIYKSNYMFKNCLVFKMYNACEALLRIIYKFKLLFETFSLPAMFQCLLIFKIHHIHHRQGYTMSRIKFINIILKGLNINPYFQYLINFLFHKYTYI